MRETIKTVKTPSPAKFYFTPKNQKEKKYLEKLQGLLKDKRRGDWNIISEKLDVPVASVKKAFFRVYQKNHFKVVDTLQKVISNRKNLLNQ